MTEYFARIAALLSQAVNCILLGGHHDQTISARAFCNRHRGLWATAYKGINAIFFWQYDHCLASHLADKRWAHEVIQCSSSMHASSGS